MILNSLCVRWSTSKMDVIYDPVTGEMLEQWIITTINQLFPYYPEGQGSSRCCKRGWKISKYLASSLQQERGNSRDVLHGVFLDYCMTLGYAVSEIHHWKENGGDGKSLWQYLWSMHVVWNHYVQQYFFTGFNNNGFIKPDMCGKKTVC